MGHTFRSQHLPSRLASVVYWGAGRAPIRDEYPCGSGLVAVRGAAHENAIRKALAYNISGAVSRCPFSPQHRMTSWCARAGLVAACTNAPARRVERAERVGVLVGRGPGRPSAGRSGSAWPVGGTASDEMVDRLLAGLSGAGAGTVQR